MKHILETTRLYLREIEESDLDFLTALHRDPDVMRYIGPPRTRKAVRERIEKIRQSYVDFPGRGIWMACEQSNDNPIGWGCLKDLDGTELIEIGYRLAKDAWGKGYATEIARALVEYGFNGYGLEKIVGVTTPDNIGSQKVLEKAGLVRNGSGRYYNSDVFFYELLREEWHANQRAIERH